MKRPTTLRLLIASLTLGLTFGLTLGLTGCDSAEPEKPKAKSSEDWDKADEEAKKKADDKEAKDPSKELGKTDLGSRGAAPDSDAEGDKPKNGDGEAKADGETDGEDAELPEDWGGLNDETRELIATVIIQAQGGSRAIDNVFQAVAGLTDEKLHSYGKVWYDNRVKADEVVKEGPYVERAQKLAKPVLALGKRKFPYKVTVIESDVVNAFATAGGYIYLHTGLMDALDDEQLRFVIGHEIGHIEERHTDSVLTYADRVGLLAGENAAAVIATLLSQHIGVGYSEAQELEADKWGLLNTLDLGVTAEDAIGTFKILAESTGESLEEEKEAETVLEELARQRDNHYRTHPPSRERIKQIEELTKKNK